ncbi:GNAT family N-acetyltransferase [Paenibacillus ginsengarvi]|uniref:N-acetyltransferase n=1 Tax=Paenibacillus ginsengarvi TaxID=400777 RepID=A0A3B0BUZ8_9BACL|nr:GNAT family N-acetyltransferase [Paenibacillus ginsengarvi]RKN76069.1 N-acetyltransferase [Paenibacillus ginsengarvi]
MVQIRLANSLITDMGSEEDYSLVGNRLYAYNVRETRGLLKLPGRDINLYLRDAEDRVVGGLFCETWSYSLYIDMFWIDDSYRNQGCGKAMLAEAERQARELGCIHAHTNTFSYQAPHFYERMGYEVFGVNDGFPDGIKQYFLRKKL